MSEARFRIPSAIIKALKKHEQASEKRRKQATEAERLYEQYVRPCSCAEIDQTSIPYARDLIDWVNEFEGSCLRTTLQYQLGEADVPICRKSASLEAEADGSRIVIEIGGELRIRIHPEGGRNGIYRYAEICNGVLIHQNLNRNNIDTPFVLAMRVPPVILKQIHREVVVNQDVWPRIERWVKTKSAKILRNTLTGG